MRYLLPFTVPSNTIYNLCAKHCVQKATDKLTIYPCALSKSETENWRFRRSWFRARMKPVGSTDMNDIRQEIIDLPQVNLRCLSGVALHSFVLGQAPQRQTRAARPCPRQGWLFGYWRAVGKYNQFKDCYRDRTKECCCCESFDMKMTCAENAELPVGMQTAAK
ncbi:hypothetical protein XENORESO_002819 [Xenotaenia resolanae]|uniref:Uncharacterized protein n=1 Tax=Xenotaenia resolanae TaxID=208358 RepID=A0ABV0W378_9TELE